MARHTHVSHLRDWILHEACLTHLEASGAPFIVVSGSHAKRMATAAARSRPRRGSGEAPR